MSTRTARSRVAAGITFMFAVITFPTMSAFAYQVECAYPLNTVKGKLYANVNGKLYPATYNETKLPNGKIINAWWAIDYSSYLPPTVDLGGTTKPGGSTKPGGTTLKGSPTTGKDAAAKSSAKDSPISVRDVGSKHYITISADVLFDFDKSDLTEKAEAVLTELAPTLRGYQSGTVLVTGHTDAIGTDEYNQELSEKRAKSVKEWLSSHDCLPGPTATSGCGEHNPVAPNTYNDGTDFPQGRAKNRRVEIVVDTAAQTVY